MRQSCPHHHCPSTRVNRADQSGKEGEEGITATCGRKMQNNARPVKNNRWQSSMSEGMDGNRVRFANDDAPASSQTGCGHWLSGRQRVMMCVEWSQLGAGQGGEPVPLSHLCSLILHSILYLSKLVIECQFADKLTVIADQI